MNKLTYLVSFMLAFAGFSWSQSNQDFVYWQKSIGAKGEDNLSDMVHDSDENFYVVGSTQAENSQSMDVLVAKYSANGIELWKQVFGESGDDRGVGIELVNDEIFVVASSNSTAGIFGANSGREDIILLKLTSSGSFLKSSNFGGNLSDIPTDISKTNNGDLLISAQSQSNEGFLNSNYGQSDMLALRVTTEGDLIWKQNYGGSEEDFSVKIDELPNGEIVLFGHSSSFDGDIGMNYGDLDLTLFKLSANGTIIWEQNYGGLQSDVGVDLLINENSEIILAGNTLSLSYDISKNAGFSDAWVLEIDPSNGGILWEETHGTEFGDYAAALALDENNALFLMGTTNASTFYGEQSAGSNDAWLAQVKSPKSINHLALFGGEGFEAISNFKVDADGSILLIGTSNSTNDLFATNHGNADGWLMKAKFGNQQESNLIEAITAHPNPTNGIVYLNNLTDSDEITVFNSMGQIVVESFQPTAFSEVLDLKNLRSGAYFVKINRASNSELIQLRMRN